MISSNRRFGNYQLLERIGVGGMAEVLRAVKFGQAGPYVALKRILPSIAEDDEFLTEFHDEGRIVSRLSHPNIARILDIGSVDGAHYIAFEFIDGKSLRELLSAAGEPLPLVLSLYITSEIASALSYAHLASDERGRPLGLVHRDVSPANILAAFDGSIKLIDFGVAKAAGRVTRTQVGDIKGKLGYMSPEQVSGRPVDGRSDVFSLGICLWECLTGQPLFDAPNELLLVEQIRYRKIVPPSTLNSKIPPKLDTIVLKALAKDSNDRYATASQFDVDLKAFAQELSGLSTGSIHSEGPLNVEGAKLCRAYLQSRFPSRASSSVPSLGVLQENRMSDKGGSDLDVFDGLAGNKPHQSAPVPSAPPPSLKPPMPPAAPPPPVRQKTLVGLAAPPIPPAPPSRVGTSAPLAPPGALPPPAAPSMPAPGRVPAPAPPPSRASAVNLPPPAAPPPAAPSPRSSLPPRPPPAATSAPMSMDWDDEDEKTAIYDKATTEDAARALLRGPAPAAGAPPPPLPAAGAPPSPGFPSLSPPASSGAPSIAPATLPQGVAPVMAAPPPQVVVAPQPAGNRYGLLAVAGLLVACLAIAAVVLFKGPNTGKLVITVAGPGQRAVDSLQIYVDGQKKCDAAPCILKDLEPGTHMVRVAAPGYQETADQAVKVPGGDEVVFRVDLQIASGGTGLKVMAEGTGLKLFIDGKEIGPLPQELKDLTPGEKLVKIAGTDRFEAYEEKVNVEPDQIKQIGPLKLKVKKGLAHIKLGAGAQGARVVLVTGNDRRPIPADKLDNERGLKIDITTDKTYHIEATKNGFAPYREEITFPDGEAEKTFEIALTEVGKEPRVATGTGAQAQTGGGTTKAATPAATGNGTLNINSIPVSNVILNGRPLGQTPRAGISVPAGNHTVVFVHPEHGRKVVSARVEAGKSRTVAVRFP